MASTEPDIEFGPFRIDRLNRCLSRNGVPLGLGGRAFDVLTVLASAPGETVGKGALLDRVWPGLTVEENSLQVQISVLRKTLGEGWIVTIPGRGYRLTPPSGPPAPSGRDEAEAARSPDKPSIAVSPFQNMSGDPEQEYFANGMTEEIVTALSRIRSLLVVTGDAIAAQGKQPVNVKRVGRELGVRYVLEGSVRKAGNQVRITSLLIDAATGAHLWADRFDGPIEAVFELQDKVASSVAGLIEPALQAAETGRSTARPTADLTAYDLYLRACAMFWSSARVPEALRLLEAAISRDPRYGPALAWAAQCHARLLLDGRHVDAEAERQKCVALARRALEVAADDAAVLANAAEALAHMGEDIDAMTAFVDRALALNPNYARGWHISAVLRMMAGQPELAIVHENKAMRLSPRVRIGSSFNLLGHAHFLARRFDEAVPSLLLAIQENPSFAQPYRVLAACYAHLNRLDDAREIIARLRPIAPVFGPDVANILRNTEHRELLLSGLRLASGNM